MSLKRRRPLVPRPPWFTFVLGGAIAVVWTLPLLVALAETLRDRPPDAEGFRQVVKLTALLTALPAFLAGGGVARAASDAVHFGRSRRRRYGVAAAQMALAGLGLAVIALAPYGLPTTTFGWLGGGLLGALAAAPAGPAIAAVTAWRVRRTLPPTTRTPEGARARS